MNALTPSPQAQAAQGMTAVPVSVEPRMSRALAIDVERLTDPDPAARALRSFDRSSFTLAQREEAEWAAGQFRALLVPATRGQITTWLGDVNRACRNPQDRESFHIRLDIVVQDCGHLPGGCFSTEGRRALDSQTRFFPASADVLAALEPLAKRMQAKLTVLERIAAPPPEPRAMAQDGRRVPPSAEVVAHVAAQMRALREDLAAHRADLPAGHEGRPGTPIHLSPTHLMAELRGVVARGGPTAGAAALRLKVLERRMGATGGQG